MKKISPKIRALSLGFAFEYKMHKQGIITLPMPFKTLTRSIRHKDPQEARRTTGVKNKYLASDEATKSKGQRKDNQKYSTTNMNINCPRTMSIRKHFRGDRDIQEYPHKINHMAKDKN